jgi:CO/xanthine dehydrogenase Mo-binding subunit
VLRTSSQTPFLTRDELCRIYGMEKDQVRVVAKRIGGGFGGKQEMLTEDIVALAVLSTGRPVHLELTREEEFTAATTRHPMEISVKLGATRDGTLTALALTTTANTGAYGNHGPGVLLHSVEEVVTAYRCVNKRVDGYAVYTNTVPAGAFRGYGLSQTAFAVESAIDELARRLGIDPAEFRRRNLIGQGDELTGGGGTDEVSTASAGARDCLDLVEKALASGRGEQPPKGWLTGTGIAVAMLDTIPPGGHDGQGRAATRRGVPRVRRDQRIRQRDHDGAPAARRERARLRSRRRRGDLVRHRRVRPRQRRVRVHRHRGGRHRRAAGGAGAG